MTRRRLRLHHRRRRLGGLRARQPAVGRPGRRGCCCSRPAGRDRNFWLRLPVGYFRTIYDPRFSRLFDTEPAEGTAGRNIVWPRGRVLGGSSSINGLIFIRGQHAGLRRLGARSAPPAGAIATCCRTSSAPSATQAARASTTARAASSASPTCATTIPTARPGCDAGAAVRPAAQSGLQRARPTYGVGAYQLSIRNGWRCERRGRVPAAGAAAAEPDACVTGAQVDARAVRADRAPSASSGSQSGAARSARAPSAR